MHLKLSPKLKTGITYAIIFFVMHFSLNYWLLEKNLSSALLGGAIFGLILGCFNGFYLNRFGVPKYKLDSISIELAFDEKILFQSAANFITHTVYKPGQLFITNKSILFKEYNQSNEDELLLIDLLDIKGLEISKLLFIFDNGLQVYTNSKNQPYQFSIDKIKELKSFMKHSGQVFLHSSFTVEAR